MVQVKTRKTIFAMHNISNLLEFCSALREMDTGLFRVFSAISSNRNRLNNNQSRTAPRNLFIEIQLAVCHSAVGIAVPEFDRRKDKSIDKLQIT